MSWTFPTKLLFKFDFADSVADDFADDNDIADKDIFIATSSDIVSDTLNSLVSTVLAVTCCYAIV